MPVPLKVFISYAHEDDAYRQRLGNHLSTLVDQGLIQLWHDHMIVAGREWEGVIADELRSADIVLLLVSAYFLSSDYCNDVELTEAIRLHDAGKAHVVPVILRSCDWKHSRFARFGALPPRGVPIAEGSHPEQRFTAVAEGLRRIVADLRRSPTPPSVATDPTTDVGPAPRPSDSSPERRRGRRGAIPRPGPEPPALALPPESGGPHLIKIGQIRGFGLEIGPFEVPLPGRPGPAVGLALLLAALAVSASLYLVALSPALLGARDALRMARYDTALAELGRVPGWLAWWPGLGRLRDQANLGAGLYAERPDWESLGSALDQQRAAAPDDAVLLVLDATMRLRHSQNDQDYDQVRALALSATQSDADNAEAWDLLGWDRDLYRDAPRSVEYYRKAVDAAPRSPQYRNNLARALLETGRVDAAIGEYQTIDRFPLARIEQALGHWARGELDAAAAAQRQAIEMLDNPSVMANYYNRRDWRFLLPDQGVRLAKLEDKRCYALLGQAASRRLSGAADVPFPPQTCPTPPLGIAILLADNLCRFVADHQPSLAPAAGDLRRALGQSAACPASPAPPAVQPGANL